MTHKPTIHEATQRVKWLKQDLTKAEQALEDAWARQTATEGGSVNIPDEAVEAAARAAYDDAFMAHAPDYLPRYDEEDGAVKDSWRKVGRASLEAAAPFLMAQAWEEGYEAGDIDNDPGVRSKIERGRTLPLSNPYR